MLMSWEKTYERFSFYFCYIPIGSIWTKNQRHSKWLTWYIVAFAYTIIAETSISNIYYPKCVRYLDTSISNIYYSKACQIQLTGLAC